ncbi:MAG: hypothetical protein ABSH49_36610 [Bryobacteraceae bacterium]
MPDSDLNRKRLEVLDALSSGANLSEAAAAAGAHRNTIAYWRRSYPEFHRAFAHAQDDRAILRREKADAFLDRAFQTLGDALSDPKASPSTRVKAAIFIIQTALAPRSEQTDQAPQYLRYAPRHQPPLRRPAQP